MEPPPPSQRILIFGATGKIGTYITSAIANASPPFSRVAIYTSASTVAAKAAQIDALKTRGVEVIVGELDDEEKIKEAYMGFDTIVSSLGRAILARQTRLIALAAANTNPVRRFFPSEYGTDVLHRVTPDPHDEPPHKYKLEARALLERVAAGEGVEDGSDGDGHGHGHEANERGETQKEGPKRLSHTYIVTGPYAEFYVGTTGQLGVDDDGGDAAWDRAGGFDVLGRRATLLVNDERAGSSAAEAKEEAEPERENGTDPIALTIMPDTALFVLSALRRPRVAHNAALRCHSFATTPRAVLREFERQTSGPGTWQVRYLGVRELRERERRAYERADAEKGLFSVRRIWTLGGSVYEDGWDDGVLGGWERGTLEGVVRGEIERQRREVGGEAESAQISVQGGS